MRLLILAGTEDGRELAEVLKLRGYDVLVSALTAYGADLALEQGLPARSGAMDVQTLSALLTSGSFAALIDATHPYALKIKETARKVCKTLDIPYLRWERSALNLGPNPLLHWAETIPLAAQIAAGLGKRIFLTTGSKDLPEWLSPPFLKNKELYLRVLPTSQVLTRCELLGFKPRQIIAAQGPFSQEWNEAMFKQLDIDVVIAKESGKIGGTLEKLQACLSLHIPLVLLKRPFQETKNTQTITVNTLQELIKKLEELS